MPNSTLPVLFGQLNLHFRNKIGHKLPL
jgi:hypothetical protein